MGTRWPDPIGVEQARSTLPSFAGPSIPGSIASGLISRSNVGSLELFQPLLEPRSSEKPSAVVTTKSNERRSRVTEASTCPSGSKQRAKRSALAISIRADHHKGRLGEAFGFEPSPASPHSEKVRVRPWRLIAHVTATPTGHTVITATAGDQASASVSDPAGADATNRETLPAQLTKSVGVRGVLRNAEFCSGLNPGRQPRLATLFEVLQGHFTGCRKQHVSLRETRLSHLGWVSRFRAPGQRSTGALLCRNVGIIPQLSYIAKPAPG